MDFTPDYSHNWLYSFLLASFLIWILENLQKHHERNFCMLSADAAVHCTMPDCLLPSAMETPTYTWPVSRLSSSRFSHNALFSQKASGYRQNERSQTSLRIIPFVLYSDKSESGIRCSLLPSPCVSMYWRMTSIGEPPALSRQKLWLQNISFQSNVIVRSNMLKYFSRPIWNRIIQNLFSVFYNQNQMVI